MKIKCWIEALRLRTLPVSCAGVVCAWALALIDNTFRWEPGLICLVFALLAQIASNLANEYFDYRAGLDRPGRVGPRRGVTEGDISPGAMLLATLLFVAAACGCGLLLLKYGPWWLILVGVAVVVGLFSYSAGPYPLSRHALGEVAVVLFFGVVPVVFCCYILSGHFGLTPLVVGFAIGLLGANILIINNYRDVEDDEAVGKHTLATVYGRKFVSRLYLANGLVAMSLMWIVWRELSAWYLLTPITFLAVHFSLWWKLRRSRGRALNPMLGKTAIAMFGFAAILFLQLLMR